MASTFPGSLDDFTRAPSDGVSPLNSPRLSVLVNDLEMALEAVQSALGINLGGVSLPGHTHAPAEAGAAPAGDLTAHISDTTDVHGIPDTSLLLTTSSSIPASAIDQTPHTAYTPIWTSNGTGPVLGNGTSAGEYVRLGNLVVGHANLTAGSTSTYGSGSYFLSLPVPARFTSISIGTAILSSGGGTYYIGVAQALSATTASIFWQSSTGSALRWGVSTPFTFASGNTADLQFVYEAA